MITANPVITVLMMRMLRSLISRILRSSVALLNSPSHWLYGDRALRANGLDGEDQRQIDPALRDAALEQSGSVKRICTCFPTALYYQANAVTDESWYYYRVEFPDGRPPIKNTFSGGQLASASEYKKRLLGIAPGAVWTGTSQQLDSLLQDQIGNIKTVETIDFIEAKQLGYHLGNAVKYISRAPHKGREIEDLKKAVWYINREIERLEADKHDNFNIEGAT